MNGDLIAAVNELRVKLQEAEEKLRCAQFREATNEIDATAENRLLRRQHSASHFINLLSAGNPRSLILSSSTFNKGTAFNKEEREDFHLKGLLPPQVETLEIQVKRAMQQLKSFDEPLNQHIFLMSTQERNETLFYKIIMDNIEMICPLIYTPVVGIACKQLGQIFRDSKGLYVSRHDRGNIREILDNWPHSQVDIIVVTDGSRILGLGDLGANGMGIPCGKLSLYVAGAGFHPSRTLPVMLDMGTDNEELLADPLYLGLHEKRYSDEEFFGLTDEFVDAVLEKWPGVLVQFEDFSNNHVFELLDRHRHKRVFNDDIQGTGAVILAGFINASKAMNIKPVEQRLLFFGAGSASIGVADRIVAVLQMHGLSEEDARKRCWFFDSRGLVASNRGDVLAEHKLPYARVEAELPKTLIDAIRYIKPTGLIGLSGQGSSFQEDHVRLMADLNANPLIMALSNPAKNAECSFEDCIQWTDGRAIFASGSPFNPVDYKGKTYHAAQGNNMYIFPGLGYGAQVCHASRVTDEMIIASAVSLAGLVTTEQAEKGLLYPALKNIRNISVEVAISVIEKAYEQGVARLPRPANLKEYILQNCYVPQYEQSF